MNQICKKYALLGSVIAACTVATVMPAAAQACLGSAALTGQSALGLGVGFPRNATEVSARFDHNAAGPLAFFANYGVARLDNGGATTHGITLGTGYELPTPLIEAEITIQGCPQIGLAVSGWSENGASERLIHVPVGFGLGTQVSVGENAVLLPFVIPQVAVGSRTLRVGNDSDTDGRFGFGATVGSLVDLGPFFVGGQLAALRWREVPGTNTVFTVRGGVRF